MNFSVKGVADAVRGPDDRRAAVAIVERAPDFLDLFSSCRRSESSSNWPNLALTSNPLNSP
jgi:hypothetical protein